MRVPPGASRQCKIVQRILLNLREQRRDGIAVVEPGKLDRAEDVGLKGGTRQPRSEEHTSELQSLMRISYAVFCLKKKKTKMKNIRIQTKQLIHTRQKYKTKQS